FLAGLPFNDVLLFGERGTGKSSSVRGVLARYGDRGLRVVEVDRRDLVHLPRILRALRAGDEHHFIVFCDDLSFGPGESGYRELKAALEGSLEAPASNVCIVATSNRRHLVPESMAENREARVDAEGELHLGEALEEKLALVDRFGLRLGFYNFDQTTYLEIVSHYLAQAGFDELDEATRRDALRWALERGSRSGRTARQFVDDVVGRRGLGA
ncbi:MAG: ATP-binding protein, partial [Actinomycetota bacterium]|nr:ATP-binding protein [Actinomycetota bacterium]